jgi:hypothetical protein
MFTEANILVDDVTLVFYDLANTHIARGRYGFVATRLIRTLCLCTT